MIIEEGGPRCTLQHRLMTHGRAAIGPSDRTDGATTRRIAAGHLPQPCQLLITEMDELMGARATPRPKQWAWVCYASRSDLISFWSVDGFLLYFSYCNLDRSILFFSFNYSLSLRDPV